MKSVTEHYFLFQGHFLLYGNGQQTWEYSPQYALRSYMYLLVHMVPAKLCWLLFEPNPMHVFYFVRCLLSVGCTLSEIYFYKLVQHFYSMPYLSINRKTFIFIFFIILILSEMYVASLVYILQD